jgi:hypothetical protein
MDETREERSAPKGHGDFANLIRKQWTPAELRALADDIVELERHPGFQAMTTLLKAREALLVDRLVVEKPDDIRSTDQVIGMLGGLRQGNRAVESILYEAQEARERALAAAREADAKGATSQ